MPFSSYVRVSLPFERETLLLRSYQLRRLKTNKHMSVSRNNTKTTNNLLRDQVFTVQVVLKNDSTPLSETFPFRATNFGGKCGTVQALLEPSFLLAISYH